ncbi:hypothetical protein [Streptomyces sp. NPDC005283]|uniref:hypothetical protein n=1 Tax=Streptomyces sp. NPDC005283 TaxID=3156871 RepID=UPI003456838C
MIVYDGVPKTIEDSKGATEGWMETDDGAVGLGEPTGSMAWFPGNHHPSDKAMTSRLRLGPRLTVGVAPSRGQLIWGVATSVDQPGVL